VVATHIKELLTDRMSFPDILRLIVRYLPDEQHKIYQTNQMFLAGLLQQDMKKGMEFEGFNIGNKKKR
jgi:hypothetical protein